MRSAACLRFSGAEGSGSSIISMARLQRTDRPWKAQPAQDHSEAARLPLPQAARLKLFLWDKGWGLTVVALAAIVFHLVFPHVRPDNTTIVLLIVAAWPLLKPWIKSIEFLGLKLELDQVKAQLGGVQHELRRVHDEVAEGFEAQTNRQETVLARVARIESLLQFSGLPVPDERQQRITDLVRSFLAYMRDRGARFGAEPRVKVVPGTEFGQSVHYDPSANELVVGLAMVDEDDFILRECCFRVLHEPLADPEVKRAVGELATSGRGFEVGSLIAGLGFYFVCSFNDRPQFVGEGEQILDLERPERSSWAPALVLGGTLMNERDRLSYITAVGDRWAHVLWAARAMVGREAMDEMILETWNGLNVENAFQLGHATFRAALSRRLAQRNPEAAAAMERLAEELLKQV